MPFARGDVVVIEKAGFIVSEKVADTDWVPPSAAFSINVEVPAAAGVPLITPVFRLRPAGSVPDTRDQV